MHFWEGHVPHTISLIGLKFDPQVQLNVLYKKASWTIKVRLTIFFANLQCVAENPDWRNLGLIMGMCCTDL